MTLRLMDSIRGWAPARTWAVVAVLGFAALPGPLRAQRQMERLDRGVVAVRNTDQETFVSWRVLGTDGPSTNFNLYRVTGDGEPVKLNRQPLDASNFTDSLAPVESEHTYFVRPIEDGAEQAPSVPFTIGANGPAEPAVRIPLRPMPGHVIHFVWIGDLDGDGEYDFVLDRLPRSAEETQKIEAYTRHGERLWTIDLGPGSLNRNNIEPGPSTIDTGHWDGVTVYDFDGDGRAEVALRSADGVIFGDGTTLSGLGENVQAVSIIDGLSGTERARAELPRTYIEDGPLAAHLGVAYLDGVRPSLVGKFKNRVGRGGFNLVIGTWDLDEDDTLEPRWAWHRENRDAPDAHQIRVFDVDGDGRDEICDGGYVLDPDGRFRHKVGGSSAGVVHGDRFHYGDFDPSRPGFEGFLVQQRQKDGLHYLVFDAATGKPIHMHHGEMADIGRGVVADVDPAAPGAEYWAFGGIHRIGTGELVSRENPWPNFRIWWDGDVLAESLNDGKVEKWDPRRRRLSRLFTVGSRNHGVAGTSSARGAPQLYGDIFGDWREEIVSTNADYSELIVCTTNLPTDVRLPTLAHNPAYRLSMAIKGYLQCHHPDYFIGHGMKPPPRREIDCPPLVLQPYRNCERSGGVSIVTVRPAFRGAGYAAFSGPGHLEWTRVNGAGGGARDLFFRYANPGPEPRAAVLVVNGEPQDVEFPPAARAWGSLRVTLDLRPAATNVVRLESRGGSPMPDIDCLAAP